MSAADSSGQTLDESTDELNKLLGAAEARLREARFGVEGWVELSPTKAVGFAKEGASWKLMVDDNGQHHHVLTSSRATRVMAAAVMSTLEQALEKNRAAMAIEVNEAKRMLREWLETPFTSHTEEPKP